MYVALTLLRNVSLLLALLGPAQEPVHGDLVLRELGLGGGGENTGT